VTRMSDARSKKRFERKQKERGIAISVPLVVTFCDVGVKYKQRVVLFCSDDPEPEPAEENIVAVLPVRGELSRERKEDIVRKFVALASSCIVGTSEDSEDWKILGKAGAKAVRREGEEAKTPAVAENFWPSFLKSVDAKIDKKE
jgi:hypothetical protein